MIESILDQAATLIVGALAEAVATEAVGGLVDKLRQPAVKTVWQEAIGVAVKRYADTASPPELAEPLLTKNFINKADIAAELAKLVQFGREPDAREIGRQWLAFVGLRHRDRDFSQEAQKLLGYIEEELRGSEVFRPVFDARALEAIAADTSLIATQLGEVTTYLASLAGVFQSELKRLREEIYSVAPPGIELEISDDLLYIAEKTRGFVGRQFVFDRVSRFLQQEAWGYFFIYGEPGVGKTALAAQLVKTHAYLHHFNRRSQGIDRADAFLTNICAQLVARYGLSYGSLPPHTGQDGRFFNKLLGDIAGSYLKNEKLIIVVDALDEVVIDHLPAGTSPLYLPNLLPENVYLIVTQRRGTPHRLKGETILETLDIDENSADNIADVRAYLAQALTRPGIQRYLARQSLAETTFAEQLEQKSEYNFMYLRYVLAAIEEGIYQDVALKKLPQGLRDYYDDHWQRLKGLDETAWFDYKLKVLVGLTLFKEPVSVHMIARYTGVPHLARIRTVLQEWGQFLDVEEKVQSDRLEKYYSIYHASFYDFIAAKEVVQDERFTLEETEKRMADQIKKQLGY